MLVEEHRHTPGSAVLSITQIGGYNAKEGIVIYVESGAVRLGGLYTADHISELIVMFERLKAEMVRQKNEGKRGLK